MKKNMIWFIFEIWEDDLVLADINVSYLCMHPHQLYLLEGADGLMKRDCLHYMTLGDPNAPRAIIYSWV